MAKIVPNIKTGKRRDVDIILKFDLNEEKDKIVNSCPLPLSKGRKRGEEKKRKKGERT